MTRTVAVVLAALAASLATAACGAAGGGYAARVNGATISAGDLNRELDAILANEAYLASIEREGGSVRGQGNETLDAAFVARILTRQILFQLVHEGLASRGVTVAQDISAFAESDASLSVGGPEIFAGFPESYRAMLARRNAEVTALQANLAGISIDAGAVQRYYNENQARFAETCASHILITAVGADGRPDQAAAQQQSDALQAKAAAVRAAVAAGQDFAGAARAESKDSSAAQGGSLGCGPAGRFVAEFETAMTELSVGQVSEPVRTQFGWHLIKVDQRRPRPLADAEIEIRQRLLAGGNEQFGTFLNERLGAAEVTVNPRYGRFDRSTDPPRVVPPGAPASPATPSGS
ncbi:MAG: peptidylprolyl isomerase [Acidimicrobiales bacterium]